MNFSSSKIIKEDLLKESFYFISNSLILFFVLEIVLPGIISVYFNLNILLVIWFVLFILLLKLKNI